MVKSGNARMMGGIMEKSLTNMGWDDVPRTEYHHMRSHSRPYGNGCFSVREHHLPIQKHSLGKLCQHMPTMIPWNPQIRNKLNLSSGNMASC